jgi:hypothetical protein
MPDEVQLTWTFEPVDVFEEHTELQCEGHTFVIDRGTVVVLLPHAPGCNYEELCNQLHQTLDAAFLGAQLCNHRPYKLSRPGIVRIAEDGTRHHFVRLEGAGLEIRGSAIVDVVQRGPDGRIIVDTKRDRITARNALASQVTKQIADLVASAITRSYAAAVNDPRNELIHLYEIRDALSARFGSEQAARTALGIGETSWRALGRLANDAPLAQGRHRGQHPAQLREATEQELTDSRKIARDMIERYLRFLTGP